MDELDASLAQRVKVLADALPYIRGFQGKTFVVRYDAGAVADATLQAAFGRDIALLRLVGMNPVVVHGGRPQMDETLAALGATPTFHRGARVIDEKTMKCVEMVLGELNQEIVGLINQHGGRAVGLNGQDAHFIHARALRHVPAPGDSDVADLGFVGEVERVDPDLIDQLIKSGYIPVIMPIGVGARGEAYSVDADFAAARIAETLRAEQLLLLTDAMGIADRGGRLLNSERAVDIERTLADGAANKAMVPTLEAALYAVRHGVRSAHIIDGRVPHALLLEVLTSEGLGTTVLPDDAPTFLADSRRYLERRSKDQGRP